MLLVFIFFHERVVINKFWITVPIDIISFKCTKWTSLYKSINKEIVKNLLPPQERKLIGIGYQVFIVFYIPNTLKIAWDIISANHCLLHFKE